MKMPCRSFVKLRQNLNQERGLSTMKIFNRSLSRKIEKKVQRRRISIRTMKINRISWIYRSSSKRLFVYDSLRSTRLFCSEEKHRMKFSERKINWKKIFSTRRKPFIRKFPLKKLVSGTMTIRIQCRNSINHWKQSLYARKGTLNMMKNFIDVSKKKTNNEKSFVIFSLKNLGASCYMNSILQCLLNIDPFRYDLMMTNHDLISSTFLEDRTVYL